MKICFSINDMGSGGAERVVSILCNSLVSKNNDICLLLVSSNKRESFYKIDNRVRIVPLISKLKEKGIFSRLKAYKRFLIREKPDIVVSFLSHVNVYTSFACKKLKIPFVLCERSNPFTYSFVIKCLLRYCFKKATGCVFQTNHAMTFYGRNAKKKGIVLINPVTLDYIPNGIIKRKKQIISVGRLVKSKNYQLLIDSFKIFSKKCAGYKLLIYGEGDQKQLLIDHCKKESLLDSVVFMGNSSSWQADSFDSSLFVLTSNFEGMPNSLLEALSIGMPCISTDCPVGGPKYISTLTDRLSLVKCGDKKELASTMVNICSNISAEKYDCSFYEKVSAERIASQWLLYLEEVYNRNN